MYNKFVYQQQSKSASPRLFFLLEDAWKDKRQVVKFILYLDAKSMTFISDESTTIWILDKIQHLNYYYFTTCIV